MPLLKVTRLDSEEANGDVVHIPKNYREGIPRNHTGEQVQFIIRKCWIGGTLFWSMSHTNPALRIASQLGVVSLILGVVSIIPLAIEYGPKLLALFQRIAPT